MNDLALPYDLFLLAHSEAGIRLPHKPALCAGLAGALVSQLLIDGAVTLVGDSLAAGREVRHTDPSAAKLAGAVGVRRMRVREWLPLVAADLYEETAAQLVAQRVVAEERRGLFRNQRSYPPVGTTPLVRARSRIRLPLTGGKVPEAGDLVLCALVPMLGLEETLYLSESPGQIRPRLAVLAAAAPAPLRAVMRDVEDYMGDLATAVYR
ncbi:GPP34 family phosphoprotein [Nonomuraea sp. NPDC050310]|uniref:GOLPH3/VPS74 family protein n=1 Tax=unclassified Nonomuraea TaxID=2593643 RepID=UPI0033EE96A2